MKQPNKWSCLPCAFAMAFEVSLESVLYILGHDGSEIIFPNKADPYKRKNFHIQEMIDVALHYGLSVTEIQNKPIAQSPSGVYLVPVPSDRMSNYLKNYKGVLTGKRTDVPHAVYWTGIEIHE